MRFQEYLMSLDWNTFSRYPVQGSNIYLHCFTDDGLNHKFLKIENFNAVLLDFDTIIQNFPLNKKWRFTWLPVNETDKNYAESTLSERNADTIVNQTGKQID